MFTMSGIDWITAVSKNDTQVRHPKLSMQYTENNRGISGYNESVTFMDGRIEAVHTKRHDMGTMIVYSGDTLTNCAQYGLNPIDLLRWHVAQGHRITRIDPNIDAFDSSLNIGELADMVNEKRCKTRIEGILHIKECLGEGETLWVGKGKPKSWRVYDKSAEQKEVEYKDWKRIEAQFRQEYASQIGAIIANSDNPLKAIQGSIKGIVDFPESEIFQSIVGDLKVKTRELEKGESKTRQWLLSDVTSAIAKQMFAGDMSILDDIEAIAFEKLKIMIEGLRNASDDIELDLT